MAKIVVGMLEAPRISDLVIQDVLRGCGVRTEDVATVQGGAVSVLTGMGMPEAQARELADGMDRGASLVTVQAMTDEAAVCTATLLRRHGALDVAILAPREEAPPGSGYVGPDRRGERSGHYTGRERRVLH